MLMDGCFFGWHIFQCGKGWLKKHKVVLKFNINRVQKEEGDAEKALQVSMGPDLSVCRPAFYLVRKQTSLLPAWSGPDENKP